MHTVSMRRSIIFIIIVVAVVLVVAFIFRYAVFTQSIIWVSDPRSKYVWEISSEGTRWWSESIGNTRTRVIVYLSPRLIKSEISMGKGDRNPVFYAKWGNTIIGNMILNISIDSEEMRYIPQQERAKQLSLFISQSLHNYFRSPEDIRRNAVREIYSLRDKIYLDIKEVE